MTRISTRRLSRAFRPAILFPVALVSALIGCSSDTDRVVVDAGDSHAPSIPVGVYSVTGDGVVYVRWIPNLEPDLWGYRIWWTDDAFSDTFQVIADIDAFDEFVYVDNGTPDDISDDFLEFVDDGDNQAGLPNGSVNSYAISAYDLDGNESGLSLELVVDIPRPEGIAILTDLNSAPAQAGFDFSAPDADGQLAMDPSTDLWFEIDQFGIPYLAVPTDRVRIQDAGFADSSSDEFASFDAANFAPLDGWSTVGRVEAIVDHAYFFRIADVAGQFGGNDNFAKLSIQELRLGIGEAKFIWGYQAVDGERQLRPVLPLSGPGSIPTIMGGAR